MPRTINFDVLTHIGKAMRCGSGVRPNLPRACSILPIILSQSFDDIRLTI